LVTGREDDKALLLAELARVKKEKEEAKKKEVCSVWLCFQIGGGEGANGCCVEPRRDAPLQPAALFF